MPDYEAHSYSASKQFVSDLQMNEPGQVIAGLGSDKIFRDATKVAQKYGGNAEDYVKKKSSVYVHQDGNKYRTHWIENIKTGERYEMKTKINE